MVAGDALGDVLQQDSLTGLGRCDDQATLPLADGGGQIQYPGRDVLG